jgi:hypothetical protein
MAADEFFKLENFQRRIQDFHIMNPVAFTRHTHTVKVLNLGDRTFVKYGKRVHEGRCTRTHCQRSRAPSVRHYRGRLNEGNVSFRRLHPSALIKLAPKIVAEVHIARFSDEHAS